MIPVVLFLFVYVSTSFADHTIHEVEALLTDVYGEWPSELDKGKKWTPQPFQRGKRHLWTDSYGVCALISLFFETQQGRYLQMAEAIIADVHAVLAFKQNRKGRLNGATEASPTAGGLLIGTDLSEDAQELDSLLKWVYALMCTSQATGEDVYLQWAIDLAVTVHDKFIVNKADDPDVTILVQRMDADLKTPVVMRESTIGVFEAFVLSRLLVNSTRLKQGYKLDLLVEHMDEYMEMMQVKLQRRNLLILSDLLELGVCLWVTHWFPDQKWAQYLGRECDNQLHEIWTKSGYFSAPLQRRQAFRELSASLGLQVYNPVRSIRKLEWQQQQIEKQKAELEKQQQAELQQVELEKQREEQHSGIEEAVKDDDKQQHEDKDDAAEEGVSDSKEVQEEAGEHNHATQEEDKEEERSTTASKSSDPTDQPNGAESVLSTGESWQDTEELGQPPEYELEERVEEINEYWRNHLLVRDRDITPITLANSLLPGVWGAAFIPEKLKHIMQSNNAIPSEEL